METGDDTVFIRNLAVVETSCAVAALEEDSVVLADGRKLKASAIVLAVAPAEVARLTGHRENCRDNYICSWGWSFLASL